MRTHQYQKRNRPRAQGSPGYPGLGDPSRSAVRHILHGPRLQARGNGKSRAAAPKNSPPVVQEELSRPGRPLEPEIRAYMEPRLGHSFSRVRLHTGERAAESARAIGARAYTVGNHIVLGERESAQSASGRRLLAHELVHTLQQGDAPIPRGPIPIAPESSAAEREARTAEDGMGPLSARSEVPGPLVQRDLLGAVGEAVSQPFENLRSPLDMLGLPLAAVFDSVVTTSIAGATAIPIPGNWRSLVMQYAAANPADGVILLGGLARLPSYWDGGWIMNLQPGAAAMTLDDDVFVSGSLSLDTFVHELVHVYQYTLAGKVGFLESYFGMSAATIAYRWATGQPINAMRSSPHEEQAYNIEARFNAWNSSP